MVMSDVVDVQEVYLTNESELPALFSFLDDEANRLVVGMLSSIAGAAAGNALGK